jgi:hypothetical protein
MFSREINGHGSRRDIFLVILTIMDIQKNNFASIVQLPPKKMHFFRL